MGWEAKVRTTEAYERRAPGRGLAKFVFDAPTNTLVVGTGEEPHENLYKALKVVGKLPKRNMGLVFRGVFNWNDQRAWLVKQTGKGTGGEVAMLARTLAKEGIGHFNVHVAGAKETIGKVSDLAKD
jgi:hypothetical protein